MRPTHPGLGVRVEEKKGGRDVAVLPKRFDRSLFFIDHCQEYSVKLEFGVVFKYKEVLIL